MKYDQILEACSEMGYRLLAGGAEIYRVEDTVKRLLAAYGAKGDVFAIPNCLIVSLTDAGGRPLTRVRRTTGTASPDIELIERLNALSRSVCSDPPPVERFAQLVRETAEGCARYSTPVVLLGYFLGAFFFTFLFRGTVLDALAAGTGGLLAGLSVMGMDRLRVNFFFKTIAAALVLGLSVCALRASGLPLHVGEAVIGALMVLLPGILFTNFMCDLITGDTMSGASSCIRAVLTATAIALGTGVALALFRSFGFTAETTASMPPYAPVLQCLCAFLACGGFCLLYNIHGLGIALCCLGGALGWAVNLAAGVLLDTPYLCALAAAVVITIYAEIMARIRKYPITAYLVVSYFPLVPGAYIYYAMFYALQGQRELFLASGVQALGVAGCIAMGTLLVSTSVRTWTTWRRERSC